MVAVVSTVAEDFTVVEVAGNLGSFMKKKTHEWRNEIMSTMDLISKTSSRPGPNKLAVLGALAVMVAGISQLTLAQKSGPETFSSAWKASSALFQAVQNNDEEAVERILGAGKEVTSSSDETVDKLERERFSRKYQEMHRLVREPDGTTVLYIGAENWPFPIPLVSKNGAWFFDSDTGGEEILFRAIGENETTALQVCHVVTKGKDHNDADIIAVDPVTEYAQGLVSGGIANAENTARDTGTQSGPFHGYYFRVVTNNAAGTDDLASGSRTTGTPALVAYPADYRSSGVMTFIVTKNGKVYEKDLGSKTTTLAKNLKRGPDSSWHTAE
jgi:Protein of unknown function (DUF2950)